VTGALEFLREAGFGRPVQVGQRVLVIGGGNTASDAARSAIRLGGGTATIVSLESRQELLIVGEDLEQAEEEGVELATNTACLRILGDDDGAVTGAVLCDAHLDRDPDGRVTPRLVPGTEREVTCDTVLVAIGQVQHLDWLPAGYAEGGVIRADRDRNVTGKVYVGGDVSRGPSMVVDALGDGKRAAAAIAAMLAGEAPSQPVPVEVMPYGKLNSAYFKHAERIEAPLAPAGQRRASQTMEVTLAYGERDAVAEADRCMSCGVCNGCDNCYVVCPDVSVQRDARTNGHYGIRLNYCKGCLVCVQECPTGCLERAPELDFTEPDAVTRMDTAFSPYDGAHAEQSEPIARLIEEQTAAYDAARREALAPTGHNGGGSQRAEGAQQ
jgi:Pyruvate/2-oxoacid:ferredoxin oxidoreductase delta subunit